MQSILLIVMVHDLFTPQQHFVFYSTNLQGGFESMNRIDFDIVTGHLIFLFYTYP